MLMLIPPTGHAAWAAVDLLYFLPESPMTYIGEQFGWRVSVDVDTGNFKGYACFLCIFGMFVF